MPRTDLNPGARVREKLDQLLEIHGDPRLAIESAYGSLETAPRVARLWLDEVTDYEELEGRWEEDEY